jgi:hypothetical protein
MANCIITLLLCAKGADQAFSTTGENGAVFGRKEAQATQIKSTTKCFQGNHQ